MSIVTIKGVMTFKRLASLKMPLLKALRRSLLCTLVFGNIVDEVYVVLAPKDW
jgi:hypothetical protein